MSTNISTEKLKEQLLSIKDTQVDMIKNLNLNIEKFKEIKSLFTQKFNGLIDKMGQIDQNKLIKSEEDDEVSPASVPKELNWEWLYSDSSTKKFNYDPTENIYRCDVSGGYGTMTAYSSVNFSSNAKLKIKFHDTSSFGCGGFGIMSMDDPNLLSGQYEKGEGTNPLFCLCCSGPWSAKYFVYSGEAMQYRLKNATGEKNITFDFDFDNMKFTVFDPNDQEFASYDMNKLTYKENIALIFYTTSSINHSHEIIPQ